MFDILAVPPVDTEEEPHRDGTDPAQIHGKDVYESACLIQIGRNSPGESHGAGGTEDLIGRIHDRDIVGRDQQDETDHGGKKADHSDGRSLVDHFLTDTVPIEQGLLPAADKGFDIQNQNK